MRRLWVRFPPSAPPHGILRFHGVPFYLTSSGGINSPCDRRKCLWYGNSATPRFTAGQTPFHFTNCNSFFLILYSFSANIIKNKRFSIIRRFWTRQYICEQVVKTMSCDNHRPCACRNVGCKNHGRCCACVATHRERGNLPFCLYTPEQIAEMEQNRPKMPPPDHH